MALDKTERNAAFLNRFRIQGDLIFIQQDESKMKKFSPSLAYYCKNRYD